MQINQLTTTNPKKTRKRVGRGGKRGTFSGRGSKGQKARAGHRIRPGFRGGDNPFWKLFPKQRGASKKTEIKHSMFQIRQKKPAVLNLEVLGDFFKEGDMITPQVLVKRGLVKTAKKGVKILGGGEFNKRLVIKGIKLSTSAKEKILKMGGEIK